jgi:hypothetical protein
LAEKGTFSGRIRLALNEEKGKWTLTVRDMASGKVAKETFVVD